MQVRDMFGALEPSQLDKVMAQFNSTRENAGSKHL